eukprot:GHVR01109062.1.p1 GENE.GHVR01109062.1~~GHVR01109062.1.p1  ORF type:complete len:1632 (+),score=425.06 GHVR01109062.1:892-5787(+)
MSQAITSQEASLRSSLFETLYKNPPVMDGDVASNFASLTGGGNLLTLSGKAAHDLLSSTFSKTTQAFIPIKFKEVAFPTYGYWADSFLRGAADYFGILFVLVFMWPVSRLVKAIMEEKESRMKESLRMMGMTNTMLWASWYLTYMILFVTTSLLVACICIGVFPLSNFLLVFLFLCLFSLATISFCMLLQSFFSSAKLASSFASISFFLLYFPAYTVRGKGSSGAVKMAACLSVPTCLSEGIDVINNLELSSVGLTFNTMTNSVFGQTYLGVMLMLLIDSLLYFMLAAYFDLVIKQQYGTRMPWYLPFTPWNWGIFKKKNQVQTEGERETADAPLQQVGRNFEEVKDTSLIRSIAIQGLNKEFGSGKKRFTAVKECNLDIYEGEIFALLGHNGAGKTTTIGMLTGMVEPNEGDATMYGMKVSSEMSNIRQSLGVCPQHDILFSYMTVREHLEFFLKIKHTDKSHKDSIDQLIHDVGLGEKINYKAGGLSGGQRRKLSVAIALLGDNKLVFLDEPSTGMDPYSRRELWELLRREKKKRTIVLTTHFMAEADYLGDRIAIMAGGLVKCCGSSLFLKQVFGVGYTFTCAKSIQGKESRTVEIVKQHIPTAELTDCVAGEMAFRIPLKMNGGIPDLLDLFEKDGERYGVSSFSLSVTTLEEVFLLVGAHEDGDVAKIHDDSKSNDIFRTHSKEKIGVRMSRTEVNAHRLSISNKSEENKSGRLIPVLSNIQEESQAEATAAWEAAQDNVITIGVRSTTRLFIMHTVAMLYKRANAAKRDWRGLVCGVLLPVLFVLIALITLSLASLVSAYEQYQLSVDATSQLYNTPHTVPYACTNDTVAQAVKSNLFSAEYARDAFKPVELVSRNPGDFSRELMTTDDSSARMGGYFINDYDKNNNIFDIELFWNSTGRDSSALFLNEAINLHIKTITNNPNLKLNLKHEPLPSTGATEAFNNVFTAIILGFGYACIPAFWGLTLVRERETGSKHLQFISGVSIPAYWVATLLWDLLTYIIPVALTIILMFIFNVSTLIGPDHIGGTVCLLVVHGFSVSALTYCLQFLFSNHTTAQNLLLMFYILTGSVLMVGSFVLQLIGTETLALHDDILIWIFYLFPNFALARGLGNIVLLKQPFVWKGDFPMWYDVRVTGYAMIFMAAEAVVFFLLTLLIEYFITKPSLYNTICCNNNNNKHIDDGVEEGMGMDSDVLAEENRLKDNHVTDVVQVRGLTKVYKTKPPKKAIDNVWFGVPEGQCFGYLGVNGAGKTTTLKALTGAVLPTSGTASLGGLDVLQKQNKVRQLLGYCPQFDALIPELTGREHLDLFCRIKGVKGGQRAAYVNRLVTALGINEYADRPCGSYSGGNKRKLSVGLSLVGNPVIVFLDEPTSGVDPASRRFMWSLISTTMKGRAVILTTHSMEECEALCGCVAIMVGGQLRCFGPVSHLKRKFGEGFQLEVAIDSRGRHSELTNEQTNETREVGSGDIRSGDDVGDDVVDDVLDDVACALKSDNNNDNNNNNNSVGVEGTPRTPFEGGGVGVDGEAAVVDTEDKEKNGDDVVEGVDENSTPSEKVEKWVVSTWEGTEILERHSTRIVFRIPKSSVSLAELFRHVNKHQNKKNIVSFSVSEVSLEQIFIQFASEQRND